jgi:hypothetical protein
LPESASAGTLAPTSFQENRSVSLNTKALALTAGILWGGCLFLVGLANLAFPSYGNAWLQLAASIYPGYHGATGFGSTIVVLLYGFVDGAVAGWIVGWLYNRFAR